MKIKSNSKSPRIFNSHAAWYVIDDKRYYFRSKLEYEYSLILQWMKRKELIESWEYEPETFWFNDIKRGVRSYKPDFKIYLRDGSHYWVETKGYMDAKSKTKIKRFKKYYPKEQLKVISAV